MADKIPDSQMLPAGAHAEKESVHKSDRKKSLSWTGEIPGNLFIIKIMNMKMFKITRREENV